MQDLYSQFTHIKTGSSVAPFGAPVSSISSIDPAMNLKAELDLKISMTPTKEEEMGANSDDEELKDAEIIGDDNELQRV